MARVLVLGAGVGGLNVARSFSSRGYEVFAVTRSVEKAKVLRQNEIIPLIGNAKDSALCGFSV